MTSEEFYIHTEKVHAAALSFGSTGRFSIKFGHTCVGTYAFCQCKAMVTIAGNERVIGSGSRHASCGNRFLTDIRVEKSADLSFHLILFFCHLLKLPDQLHEFVPV